MSVDTPDSGDSITKTSIESMHADVAGAINDFGTGQMGGATLGPSQLPSLIHTADSLEITADSTISFNTIFDESDIGTSGGWARLSDYNLDNGTAGYELPYDGFIYAYCSLRIGSWNSNDTSGTYSGNQTVWANLWYQKDSTNYKFVRNNRFINLKPNLRTSSPQWNDKYTVEDTISIAWLEKVTAGTLDLITITAGGCPGILSSNALSATVSNGTIGFFYIPKEV